MPAPASSDYAPFYHTYVSLVSEGHIKDILRQSITSLEDFLHSIPTDKAGFAYAPGKWTVNQLLQHMIDAERVFAYRAMCFARGEKQPLPGFDENEYADLARATEASVQTLIEELLLLRKASYLLFAGLPDTALQNRGFASGKEITVNALGYVIVGHTLHHQRILRERYLS
jgi:hypothetical protein